MGASQSHDQLMPEERKLRQDPEKIARIARYLSARQGTQKSLVSAEEFSQHEQDKVHAMPGNPFLSNIYPIK